MFPITPTGRRLLERLDPANLFLMPLAKTREWYRYHHLFAELLRHQLAAISEAKQVDDLHRKASQWHEDHGFADDAIRHALAAGDWERAMSPHLRPVRGEN